MKAKTATDDICVIVCLLITVKERRRSIWKSGKRQDDDDASWMRKNQWAFLLLFLSVTDDVTDRKIKWKFER